MNNNMEKGRIIDLHYNDYKKKSFLKKLFNELRLQRIIDSHSPYVIILKVFFAVFLALIADHYISKNPDSVSSTFTAILCISTTVTKGIKACMSTFFMCCIGAIVSTLFNIICGTDTIFFWRVPLGTAITYYIMLLCRMEDDIGGLSAGAFSAIFVQLTLFEYTPLIDHTDKKWLHTFVVRLLSVFTGCVSSFIVNCIFDVVYYKFFFKTKILHFSNHITLLLHEYINEPRSQFLESRYQILNGFITDINHAIGEINYFIFKGKSFVHLFYRAEDLENYKNLLYAYLGLLNNFTFLGYQKDIMNEKEIETVRRVVKRCIMKLYSHQFHIGDVSTLEKIGFTDSNDFSKNRDSKSTGEITDELKKNNNNHNNIGNSIIKTANTKTSDIALNMDGQNYSDLIDSALNSEGQSRNTLFYEEEENLNIINNGPNKENIPESLRIPLTNVIKKTDIIVDALDHYKILKKKIRRLRKNNMNNC